MSNPLIGNEHAVPTGPEVPDCGGDYYGADEPASADEIASGGPVSTDTGELEMVGIDDGDENNIIHLSREFHPDTVSGTEIRQRSKSSSFLNSLNGEVVPTEDDVSMESMESMESTTGPRPAFGVSTGAKIKSRIRSLVLPASTLSVAIVLTAITVGFSSTSFSSNFVYTSPFLPFAPNNAIVVIQLLATLSLMTIRECFQMSCEVFRWSLATDGINFLSFLVLSEETGYWGLLCILTRKGRILKSWRALALYKFLILYVVLLSAQFVWLFNIGIKTVYKTGTPHQVLDRIVSPEFSLIAGLPFPFSRLHVWNFLDDSTQVMEVIPTMCSPETDFHCAAYVFPLVSGARPVNASDYPDASSPYFIISPNSPAYIVEFQGGRTLPSMLEESQNPWAYCHNYTTASHVSILMCMGGETRSSTEDSWIITAGWQYCLDTRNCTEIGNQTWDNNVFTTTMSIQMTNVTVISSLANDTIIDLPDIGARTNYPVNISDFFTAFTAPLIDIPVDMIRLDDVCIDFDVEGANVRYTESVVVDRFVESLAFALSDGSSPVQLRGFLTYALGTNSLFTASCTETNGTQYPAIQTYALSVSPLSIWAFAVLAGFTILSCIAMLLLYPRLNPNINSFPEVMFAGKLDGTMSTALKGLSNGTSAMIMDKFADVKIKVGEHIEDGVASVAMTMLEVDPLQTNVVYQ